MLAVIAVLCSVVLQMHSPYISHFYLEFWLVYKFIKISNNVCYPTMSVYIFFTHIHKNTFRFEFNVFHLLIIVSVQTECLFFQFQGWESVLVKVLWACFKRLFDLNGHNFWILKYPGVQSEFLD